MSPIKCITLEEEIKKNPELKMSDIQILREWCEKQPHLPKIQDVQFAIFLHCNYYRLEPTKNTIENYYTMRTHTSEFFSNRDPLKVKELRESFKVLGTFFLEEKTKEGYSISVGRLIDTDPSHYVPENVIKYAFMLYDEFIWTRGSTIGHIIIMDAIGLTFAHAARVNPIHLKKNACYLQEAFPIRLKGIHVINMSPVIELMFNWVKPFMKTELINLIHFHSTLESASKYFPIDALPNEFGGKAGSMQPMVNAQIRKIENFREWYLEDERINRVNESLRIGKSKTSDLFGVDGSFKKLEID